MILKKGAVKHNNHELLSFCDESLKVLSS